MFEPFFATGAPLFELATRLAALGFSFDQMIEDCRCDADMRGRVLAQLQTWANSMVVIAIIAVKN